MKSKLAIWSFFIPFISWGIWLLILWMNNNRYQSLILVAMLTALIINILGIWISKKAVKEINTKKLNGKWLAFTGNILSIISLIIFSLFLLFLFMIANMDPIF